MTFDGLSGWGVVAVAVCLVLAMVVELSMAWQPGVSAGHDDRAAFAGDPWTGAATVLYACCLVGGPVGEWPLGEWSSTLGLVLAFLGLLLRAWAIRELGGLFSPRLEIRGDHRLVASGPYRHLRHPGYTGALLLFAGLALALHRGLALAAVLAVALAVRRRAVREERLLEHCVDYASYRETTGRFVPRPLNRAARSTAGRGRG